MPINDNILIRQEKPSEFKAIYELVKIAFQTAKVSSGDEQDFVDRLRASGNYIPELALVAEGKNSVLIGHVMLTNGSITCGDNSNHEILILGPLAVAFENRNQGLGAKLVKIVLAKALDMGFTSVLLVGDPAYYERFGFKNLASAFGIKNTNGIPDQYVMAVELVSDALKNIKGSILFPH